MTIDAISSFTDPTELRQEPVDSYSTFLIETVSRIWNQIYQCASSVSSRVIRVARNGIGAPLRDAFFFPLKCPLLTGWKGIQRQLAIEEEYSANFWNPEKATDPNFKAHEEIRARFQQREETFLIPFKEGQTISIKCLVIETKEQGDAPYQFVQVPGIYATISNNITGIYPYLEGYLGVKREDGSLPPARFIILSENNFDFKPETLDDAGLALLKAFEFLQKKWGKIDQVVAHSLGSIFFTSALKQLEDPQFMPKHICLDRGPTSIWEVSKKYFLGFGCLLYPLGKISGWTADIEQDLINFCLKWKERPPILIAGVKYDHYFSGSANLCLGKKIQEQGKTLGIHRLVFDPYLQLVHEYAHHNLRVDFFHDGYLMKDPMTEDHGFMNAPENFAQAIIRHSIKRDPADTAPDATQTYGDEAAMGH